MSLQPALRAIIALCFSLTVVPLSQAAPPDDFVGYVEINHPGKIRLVWYFGGDFPDLNHPAKVVVGDKEFGVDPGIKPPTINSVFLLEHSPVNPRDDVLDMGTGTGVHAVFAAEHAHRVVATDINPDAIANAKRNAEHHHVAGKIDFRVGDLFGAVKADEKFDVILLNLAYPFGDKTRDRWLLHERFFKDVGAHMKPGARVYYQVGFLNNLPYIEDMLHRNHLRIIRADMAAAPAQQLEPMWLLVQADQS